MILRLIFKSFLKTILVLFFESIGFNLFFIVTSSHETIIKVFSFQTHLWKLFLNHFNFVLLSSSSEQTTEYDYAQNTHSLSIKRTF